MGLKDTIWAFNSAAGCQCVLYYDSADFFSTMVPDAIIESGKIDGAGEFRIFFEACAAACPYRVLATIGLFSTLGYWNDWFNALLYIDKPNLVPLQSMLMRIENSMQFILQNSQ